MSAPNLNYAWARAILDECVRAGVTDAVVCPGSRSSPLAVTCAELQALRTWSVIDERSAGFFALGLARASARPVVLVATSGSAGAHFLPAAIEAAMSHVPLVILTADRPWELQGFGAPQTIPQQNLFGAFARRFEDLPAPDATPGVFAHLRAVVARALDTAQRAPRGAVHLNVPFREPLAPAVQPFAEPEATAPVRTTHVHPARIPDQAALERIAALIAAEERGVIVCGPRGEQDGFAEAVHQLGRAAGYPVIAEPASQARFGNPEAIAHADLLIQNERFANSLAPKLILRFGGGITSKRLQQWLDAQQAATAVVVSDDGALIDPSHRAALCVEGSAPRICAALSAKVGERATTWRDRFMAADRAAAALLDEAIGGDGGLSEPAVARAVAQGLPEGGNLFVSSSMPIRDLDAFSSSGRPALRVFVNRGANGIDGITSTALGVSAATGRPTALLTGDLAFLHDLGGLLTAKRSGLRLTIVVVNNDGGGIFSFLPIAGATPHFEALFGTSHGLDLSHAARLFGADFHRPGSLGELRSALSAGIEGGLSIIEARAPAGAAIDRQQNVAFHRELGRRVARALDDGGWR